jgi:hypothetical protein
MYISMPLELLILCIGVGLASSNHHGPDAACYTGSLLQTHPIHKNEKPANMSASPYYVAEDRAHVDEDGNIIALAMTAGRTV